MGDENPDDSIAAAVFTRFSTAVYTNGLVQIFLIVTFFASATYNALFTIASTSGALRESRAFRRPPSPGAIA